MQNTIFFEKINGKKIFSVLEEPEKSQKKLVIMSHGFRGSSTGPARSFVNFSRALNKEGFSTLRFDHPNSGNSDGDFLNVSFKEWVENLVLITKKYITEGYSVALLGQSMGATASTIAANYSGLKSKIQCLILWVPDPESDFTGDENSISEEGGEKFYMSFWKEAFDMKFTSCLEEFAGKIHLVYGENDRYVSKELRDKTVDTVKKKNQEVMILKGQDHSPWEYELTEKVFTKEIDFLKKHLK